MYLCSLKMRFENQQSICWFLGRHELFQNLKWHEFFQNLKLHELTIIFVYILLWVIRKMKNRFWDLNVDNKVHRYVRQYVMSELISNQSLNLLYNLVPFIVKMLNLYIILFCTHLYHFFPVSIHYLQCIHCLLHYVTEYILCLVVVRPCKQNMFSISVNNDHV